MKEEREKVDEMGTKTVFSSSRVGEMDYNNVGGAGQEGERNETFSFRRGFPKVLALCARGRSKTGRVKLLSFRVFVQYGTASCGQTLKFSWKALWNPN